MNREKVSSGTPWESLVGYSRAIRVGDRIEVSGTTAIDGEQVVGVGDPAAQTRFILDRIQTALNELNATIDDVVRTRIYVTNIDDWEPIGRLHGEYFQNACPAATLVEVTRLIRPELLVEIEATAICR